MNATTNTNATNEKLPQLPAQWHKQLPPTKPLTKQQQLILTLFAEGWNTKEIADMLKVSPKTIEYHRSMLFKLLNTYSIAIFTRLAIKMGLVKD